MPFLQNYGIAVFFDRFSPVSLYVMRGFLLFKEVHSLYFIKWECILAQIKKKEFLL